MNLNKLLVATALTATAMCAQATVSVLSSGNTTTYTENFDTGSSFSHGLIGGPGNDNYMWLFTPFGDSSSSFSFSSGASNNVSVSFYYSALSKLASWTFDGVTQRLGNTNPLLYFPINPGPGGNSTADALVSYTWNGLTGTSHTLAFNTGLGGLKIDDVKIVVTAVPEPETYALMLAGLMMMGTIARRRSRNK